uniref:Uncharacterized protein n=1 Tax=Lepeophtheirus salmonis TaxID=72036 RepID=A0A0K2VF92_LEPSM
MIRLPWDFKSYINFLPCAARMSFILSVGNVFCRGGMPSSSGQCL